MAMEARPAAVAGPHAEAARAGAAKSTLRLKADFFCDRCSKIDSDPNFANFANFGAQLRRVPE
jgi:hypothetical protein